MPGWRGRRRRRRRGRCRRPVEIGGAARHLSLEAGGEAARWRRRTRAAEFAALYVGLPLVVALALPPDWLFPVLFGAAGVGLVLLARTPGFRWRELARGWRGLDWGLVLAVGAATAAVAGLLVWWLAPQQALGAAAARHRALARDPAALSAALGAAAGADLPAAVLPPLRRAVSGPGRGGARQRRCCSGWRT